MKRGLHGAVAMLLVMLLLITSMPMAALAEIVKVDTSSGIQPFSILPGGTAVLTYEFYVGGELVDTQRVGDGETLVAPKTPTQDGHKFMGWTENPDDEQPIYQSFGIPIEVTGTGTTRLYAHFEEVYYVFFMDGVGLDARVIATKEGTSGASISVADVNVPVGANQSVSGWYYDAKWNHPVENNTVTLENENIRLYPKIESGHWITFDSDGGTYVEPMFVHANDTAEAPVSPEKAGYKFKNWKLNGETFNFESPITTDITLTAEWEAVTVSYTVIHWYENANDENYSYYMLETKYGLAGEQTEAKALRESTRGTNIFGETVRENVFTAQSFNQEEIKGDGSTIVNIYYSRKEYTLTFKEPGWNGRTLKTIQAKYGAAIDWPSYAYSRRGGYRIVDDPDDGTSLWVLNQSGTRYLANLTTMPMGNATLTAREYEGDEVKVPYYVEALSPTQAGAAQIRGSEGDNRYYIEHHTDISYGTAGYTIGNEDCYPIAGFTFFTYDTEWGDSYGGSKFFYTRNSYNIIYYNGSDSTPWQQAYKYEADISGADDYKPANPPSGYDDTYEFVGWYADPAGQEPYVFDGKTMPANDVVVYAKWEPKTFKLTAYANMEGENTLFEKADIPSGTVVNNVVTEDTLSNVVEVPEGFQWRGWRILNEDGTLSPFNFNTQITRDIELYPYYTPAGYFTVTYSAGDGSGSVTDNEHYAADSYADVKSGAELEPPEGQVFLYWQVEGSDTKYYPNDKIYITGDVKLIAIYGPTPEGTQITYMANYPEGTDPDPYVGLLANNAEHTVLSLREAGFSEQAGYEFVGWSTTQHNPADDIDSEVNYPVGTEIIVNKNKADSENILYGCWKPKKGTLVIEKILPEAGGGGNEFMFEVRKKGNNEVVKTVTVTVNGTTRFETITLPEGTYTVSEVLNDSQSGYYIQPDPVNVVIKKGEKGTASFENKLQTYTVTIEKQVTGNMYNTNDEFEFEATVTFNGHSYKISDGDGYSVDPDTNKITFTLKGNESVVLKGVPKYAKVTVTETDRKDYTTSYQAGNAEKTDGETAEITVWGESSVTFINDKTVTIDTGVNLDVLPYLLMLAVAGGAVALLLVLKRRKTQE